MSIVTTKTLHCDALDCQEALVAFEEDTVADLRARARRDGWTHRKGEDRCERHRVES